MRVKKPLEATVSKYIEFLQELHTFSHPNISYFTIQERIKNVKINKSISIALVKLGIIELINDKNWNWETDKPYRELALEVLNFLLELNKKQIVTPITGLDSETKGYLKAIHDHLIHNTTKQQESPFFNKKTQNFNNKKIELFKINDDRLYISGQISSAIYSNLSIEEYDKIDIQNMNEFIIKLTNNLIKQLLRND